MAETLGCTPDLLEPLMACAEGRMPPNVALVHLFLTAADEGEAHRALRRAETEARDQRMAERLSAARHLWRSAPGAFPLVRQVMALADAGGQSGVSWQKVFDDAAMLSPEAAVALYSLGNPVLLERITAELVDHMAEWDLLRPCLCVLDLGCGSGRVTSAMAPRVGAVVAVDCSEQMARLARSATTQFENVSVLRGDGMNLGVLRDDSFDCVLAIDSFPYLVEAELATVHLQETARVLRPGGMLLIMNYSYRGNVAGDRAELALFAEQNGFDVLRNGTTDLALWDGRTFLLRKK